MNARTDAVYEAILESAQSRGRRASASAVNHVSSFESHW